MGAPGSDMVQHCLQEWGWENARSSYTQLGRNFDDFVVENKRSNPGYRVIITNYGWKKK